MTLDGHLSFGEKTVHFYKPNVTKVCIWGGCRAGVIQDLAIAIGICCARSVFAANSMSKVSIVSIFPNSL